MLHKSMSPLRHEGKPVWIGQISRDTGVRLTWRTITTHKIDPNVDETREFLVEDLAYAQALERIGYVGYRNPDRTARDQEDGPVSLAHRGGVKPCRQS